METSQELAFTEVGEGLPILIVHGWTMAGFVETLDFEPIFRKTSGYRRVYVDLPGMGSSPIGKAKDLDSMLESVSIFIARHILPSKFALIGTSCGAYLVRALAYRHASYVEGLVLRVPVVEPESSKRDVDPFVPVIANEGLISSLSATVRENLGDVPVQTPDYMRALQQRAAATWVPAVEKSDAAALDPIRSDPDRYKLTATMHSPTEPFSKPALILTGRQDTDVGFRDAWSLMRCYPRATFAALDRASHGFPVDEMEREMFEALVREWLRRVEEVRALSR